MLFLYYLDVFLVEKITRKIHLNDIINGIVNYDHSWVSDKINECIYNLTCLCLIHIIATLNTEIWSSQCIYKRGSGRAETSHVVKWENRMETKEGVHGEEGNCAVCMRIHETLMWLFSYQLARTASMSLTKFWAKQIPKICGWKKWQHETFWRIRGKTIFAFFLFIFFL